MGSDVYLTSVDCICISDKHNYVLDHEHEQSFGLNYLMWKSMNGNGICTLCSTTHVWNHSSSLSFVSCDFYTQVSEYTGYIHIEIPQNIFKNL